MKINVMFAVLESKAVRLGINSPLLSLEGGIPILPARCPSLKYYEKKQDKVMSKSSYVHCPGVSVYACHHDE